MLPWLRKGAFNCCAAAFVSHRTADAVLLRLLLLRCSIVQDGNGTNWTPSELATILAVWRGVSEDYAAFDIDVTTEEPVGVPVNLWMRAAIGGSYSDCE